jgi:hypothetical protein|tara:strand:- start:286 stop:738 length:453 start_codon:yes stop_codon:yes gene_type:complete
MKYSGDCGTYVAIGAEITKDLETFYYIKVGMTTSNSLKRCNTQRLKFVGGVTTWSGEPRKIFYCSEADVQNAAYKAHGDAPIDYNAAGHSESFGRFDNAIDAMLAAVDLVNNFEMPDWIQKRDGSFMTKIIHSQAKELVNFHTWRYPWAA